ncbi:hypothetical protein BRAS3843_770029 [Bradyrhizobium sp. STM 3843]|uniref:hypothetical protein n=1 Tax=Bradyrhizobium sp. STM 3843 TaxID=551947 RepID=UPI0002404A28|nr:hypothetical protein [Bradyrhizobium sp. STM 3843]CCE11731.1 hypothetical protein BRAS3843_770029 [Bradyrhizobium sp. STM 3843]
MADHEITLSSSGVSAAQALDYLGSKFTSFLLTATASAAFSVTIEGTLDDLTQETTQNWGALSSAITAASSVLVFTGPLAGARMNAASVSSGTLTLHISQGVGW